MLQTASNEEMSAAFDDPGDAALKVAFRLHPKQNQGKSDQEGRPVFEDVEYVQIFVPGDKSSMIDRPARPEDKRRFARQYEAFKRGAETPMEGTPLAQWPQVTRALVEELAFFHIRTVEDLASLADNHAQRFPGIQALKQKAKDYLETAKTDAPLILVRAELQQRDAEIAELRALIQQKNSQSDAPPAKRPVGRPPKQTEQPKEG